MNAFTELFGVEYPIVAFSHCRDVVAAVSRAGGLGVFGAATFTPAQLEVELRWIDDHVDGLPYGINVLAPAPFAADDDADPAEYAGRIPEAHRRFVAGVTDRLGVPPPRTDRVPMPFGDGGLIISRRGLQERVDVALQHPARLLVSALGPFAPETVRLAKDAGMVIGGMCGAVRHAVAHVAGGAEVVIAQGVEAAGHTGEISTMVLVPQVVDAVAPVPVLAAGGIGDGRQVAAALALGAQGVWTGTIWLTTQESDVEDAVKRKLLAADSGDTIRSRCLTGKPVRNLRSPLLTAWEAPDAPVPLPAPLQGLLVKDAIAGVFENRVEDLMFSAAGQVVGQIVSTTSSRTVVHDLMTELATALDRLHTDYGAG